MSARDEMKLPEGATCADCYAVHFCVGIGCTKPENTSCDYSPSRFHFDAHKALAMKRALQLIPPLPV